MEPEYIFVIYSCKKNLEHSKKMHDFYFTILKKRKPYL
jgi:hypothetical protein